MIACVRACVLAVKGAGVLLHLNENFKDEPSIIRLFELTDGVGFLTHERSWRWRVAQGFCNRLQDGLFVVGHKVAPALEQPASEAADSTTHVLTLTLRQGDESSRRSQGRKVDERVL